MDRICPFLALATDHRSVVDGFDPEHACHAQHPPDPLGRSRQAELCLSETHRQCDRYVAFLAGHAADASSYPPPASDSHIARTRLILDPDLRRRGRDGAPLGPRSRRWLVAGGIAAVGVAAAATAVGGGFNGLVGEASPSATVPVVTLAATPTLRPQATDGSTPAPTPEPTQPPASSTPAPTPQPTRPPASATPRTYVVQEGDTLSLIATRYGTSVAAIQAANGLGSDVINVGQVLVIP